MEDPEEAFNRGRAAAFQSPSMSSRISGDVSMAASNASEDGTARLRKVRFILHTLPFIEISGYNVLRVAIAARIR